MVLTYINSQGIFQVQSLLMLGMIVEVLMVGSGSHLLIVFGAYREHYGFGCSEHKKKKEDILNVYFMRSFNQGESWTSVQVLPHGILFSKIN